VNFAVKKQELIMQEFTTLNGLVAPMDRANVDTDAIIPKQFLKSIKRTGYGPFLFDEWRYEDQGEPGMDCTNRPIKSDFVLNQPRYMGAQVLLARENFGCGSSREHAPWAILDYGFSCVIAPSFADIFYNNCFKNGLLAISLSKDSIEELFRLSEKGENIHVDLINQVILGSNELEIVKFEIEDFRRTSVLEGLDEIGLSLKHSKSIMSYEENIKKLTPWIFK